MKRTLATRVGPLVLLFGLIAGCNDLIGADAPSLVSGFGGAGGAGGRAKVDQAGTGDSAGEGGTPGGDGGSSGQASAPAGAGGSTVGGGAPVAGAGDEGNSGGASGAPPCTDQACLKPPGAACTGTEQCQTGVCGAEHVCCNVACSNSCTTCTSQASPGVCSAIDFSASSDVANCGDCGTVCSTSHITATCNAGKCRGTCASGYANCSTAANDGCEVNTTNDAQNCGGCGLKCAYGLCAGSTCVSTVWGKTAHAGPGEAIGTNNNGTNLGSIIAVPVSVTTSTKLVAIGVPAYPPNTTVHMYLSLFTSVSGGPQSFLAQTGLLTMSDVTSIGPTEGLIASQPALPPGDYFIVIVSDNLFHIQDEPATETLWYNSASYTFAPLSGAIPASAAMKTLIVAAPDAYLVTAP